ncbi:MAG: hypothetical protein JXR67_10945 [Bacteroidales bacterium]|nr:hypothetical protein [Bacteroidales bacterium]
MKYLTYLTIMLALLVSCSGENTDDEGDPLEPLAFSSLTAERDTIESGESTKIIAVATGYSLSYYWTATAGDILGKGSEVVYTASPCQSGKNKITCTVKDGNNASLKKEIYIVVK